MHDTIGAYEKMNSKKVWKIIVLISCLLSLVVGCGKSDNGTANADGKSFTATGGSFGSENGNESVQSQPSVKSATNSNGNTDGTYTIMMYMIGANLESDSMLGSMHLLQLANAGIDTSKVNIVYYTGGSQIWHAFKTKNNIYGKIGGTIEESNSTTNMGMSSTLSGFINKAYEEYPADHYALILWDHGGGPILAYGEDELYQGDGLSMKELKAAFDATPFGQNERFDWVGLHTCIMGGIEEAQLFSNYSDYMLASEDSLWVGWDFYDFSILNETYNTIDITKKITEGYFNLVKSNGYDVPLTLSLLDLTKCNELTNAMNSLYESMNRDVCSSLDEYKDLLDRRASIKEFAPEEGYDLVDIGSLAKEMESKYPKESGELQKALDDFVVFQKCDETDVNGVEIIFPYSGVTGYFTGDEGILEAYNVDKYSEIALSGIQDDFYKNFVSVMETGEPVNGWQADTTAVEVVRTEEPVSTPKQDISEDIEEVTAEEVAESEDAIGPEPQVHVDPDSTALRDFGDNNVTTENDGYRINLSEEQQDAAIKLSLNIFKESDVDEGCYEKVLLNKLIESDGNGGYKIDYNQDLICLAGGLDNNGSAIEYWPIKQVGNNIRDTKYITMSSALEGPYGAGAWTSPTWVSGYIDKNVSRVNAICYKYFNERAVGKNPADLDKFDYMSYYVYPYTPKSDSNGKVLPYKEWDRNSTLSVYQIPITGMPGVVTGKTGDSYGKYYAQIICTDIYGNEYSTNLLPLKSLSEIEKYSENINGVNCQFNIYDSHADLISIDGNADSFTIPETVNGKTVKYVGDGSTHVIKGEIKSLKVPGSVIVRDSAFAGATSLETVVLEEGVTDISLKEFKDCSNLTSVELPQSLKSIGRFAFSGCAALRELNIPKSVSSIGSGAFEFCSYLKLLKVDSGNQSYKTVEDPDGNLLYSADGKTLVASPGLFRSSYEIPEGTEIIEDFAFSGSYSEEYRNRGDGDETTLIGYGLIEVKFPSSLRVIGDGAFFCCNRFKELNLPENLESIGIQAFGGTDFTGSFLFDKTETYELPKIYLGKDVEWVGQECFGCYKVKEFTVNEDNIVYSAPNGVLMNCVETEEIDVYGNAVGFSDISTVSE